MLRVCVNPFAGPFAPTATLIACAFAEKAGVDFKVDEDVSCASPKAVLGNREVRGNMMVARYLSHEAGLYGRDSFATCEMHRFVDLAVSSLSDRATLPEHCETLNQHLAMRTFLVGQEISVADIVVWPGLRENSRWLKLSKSVEKYTHLIRWYRFLERMKEFQGAIAKLAVKNKAVFGQVETGSFDVGIPPEMRGKVVTRFPPEPSGYLHIGHAKAILLNQEIARLWDGEMIVRFDDTNPSKEKDEYVESILEDLETLGAKRKRPISYTSDYFDLFLKYCTEMIKKGTAYVDDTPVEQMREERLNLIESRCRNQSPETNLKLWEAMQKGTEGGLKCVVRAKMDMKSPNGTLRDPTLYRCNLTPHHRTKSKFKVYPTYDFACPIVDSIEGVTHAFRTSEYTDRNVQYNLLWDLSCSHHKELIRPSMKVYSRLNFVYTILSKRKLNWFVEKGLVDGWDDPRFPTVRGMLRRGLTIEALKKFMFSQGFSVSDNLMQFDKLWTENKRVLDPKVSRYTAIGMDYARLHITDGPLLTSRLTPLHPKYPKRGTKVIRIGKEVLLENRDVHPDLISEGDEITLIEWGNVIIDKIDRSNARTELYGRLNLGGDVKKTRKLSWLADSGDDLVSIKLVDLDHLITVPKLEPNQKLQDFVRKDTWKETKVLGDPSIRNLQKGTTIQLQRRGFCIVDRVIADDVDGSVVLINILDGREKSMFNLPKKKNK
uniref:glutamate--tRNA ligase n=1 Tax=Hirondellea gigas TaxID=1518452 RepID=A0A6A7FZD9_9CRUS